MIRMRILRVVHQPALRLLQRRADRQVPSRAVEGAEQLDRVRLRRHFPIGREHCARIGGEEFCILLPQTDQAGAAALARRILAGVRGAPANLPDLALHYTASLGVSSLNAQNTTIDSLLRSADRALYRAKLLGRDREELAVPSD